MNSNQILTILQGALAGQDNRKAENVGPETATKGDRNFAAFWQEGLIETAAGEAAQTPLPSETTATAPAQEPTQPRAPVVEEHALPQTSSSASVEPGPGDRTENAGPEIAGNPNPEIGPELALSKIEQANAPQHRVPADIDAPAPREIAQAKLGAMISGNATVGDAESETKLPPPAPATSSAREVPVTPERKTTGGVETAQQKNAATPELQGVPRNEAAPVKAQVSSIQADLDRMVHGASPSEPLRTTEGRVLPPEPGKIELSQGRASTEPEPVAGPKVRPEHRAEPSTTLPTNAAPRAAEASQKPIADTPRAVATDKPRSDVTGKEIAARTPDKPLVAPTQASRMDVPMPDQATPVGRAQPTMGPGPKQAAEIPPAASPNQASEKAQVPSPDEMGARITAQEARPHLPNQAARELRPAITPGPDAHRPVPPLVMPAQRPDQLPARSGLERAAEVGRHAKPDLPTAQVQPSQPNVAPATPPSAPLGAPPPLPMMPAFATARGMAIGTSSDGDRPLPEAALAAENAATTATADKPTAVRDIQFQPSRIISAIADAARALNVDKQLEIRLNPEELGRVRLGLQSSDQGMNVVINVERPETLDLLRRNIDLLAQNLRDLGYEDLVFSFAQDWQGEGSENGQGGHERQSTPDHAMAEFRSVRPDLAAQRAALQVNMDGRLDIRL